MVESQNNLKITKKSFESPNYYKQKKLVKSDKKKKLANKYIDCSADSKEFYHCCFKE